MNVKKIKIFPPNIISWSFFNIRKQCSAFFLFAKKSFCFFVINGYRFSGGFLGGKSITNSISENIGQNIMSKRYKLIFAKMDLRFWFSKTESSKIKRKIVTNDGSEAREKKMA